MDYAGEKKETKAEKLSKKYADKLESMKKKVSAASAYDKENFKRFHKFQNFAFRSAISQSEEAALIALDKPVIEFNITNAPISRLCGEFSKQEPSIYTMAQDGAQVDEQQIEVVEGHIRHVLLEAMRENTQYNGYRDQLTGGLSVFKVWTEYENSMSFNQVIRFGRVYEPTLTGFDPSARSATKKDADWYFELHPMTVERFKSDNPDVDIKDIKYHMGMSDFAWAYEVADEKVLMVCHFFEKKRTPKTIVQLSDRRVMTVEEYEESMEAWDKENHLEQKPVIVGKPRETLISVFCRYKFIANKVFGYDETDFNEPNLVWVDGDSVYLKTADQGAYKQFTKPYIYHAEGIQKLVNLAGQAIANDIETQVMHKFMVCQEGLPDNPDFLDALTNVQAANTVVYKAYMIDDNGEKTQLPSPQAVPREALSPDVIQTFNTGIQMLQNILGSTDMNLGVQNNQLSGLAIIEAATQSNATAMPYIVNYMQALNQVAQLIVHLIPKYYTTARTIPIIDKEGNRKVVSINQEGGPKLDYSENAIKVTVEAGVNFAIAKNRALQQLTALMNVSPLFAQFMNEEGLMVLLDNVEFVGVDIVKEKAGQFMDKIKQQQAQAAQQPNPDQIKMQIAQQTLQIKQAELQQQAQKSQQQMQVDMEKINNDKMKTLLQAKGQQQENDVKRLQALVDAETSNNELKASLINAEAEHQRSEADLQLAVADDFRKSQDQEHQHLSDILTMAHEQNRDNQELEIKKTVAAKPATVKTQVTVKPKPKPKTK